MATHNELKLEIVRKNLVPTELVSCIVPYRCKGCFFYKEEASCVSCLKEPWPSGKGCSHENLIYKEKEE